MRLLDASQIRKNVPDSVDRIDALDEVGSTNDFLRSAPLPAARRWHLALAEMQTKGRGRGENIWLSPPGAGLWMSAVHTSDEIPQGLSSFTLAVGVAVADALASAGVNDIRLKWPNDLIVRDRKLGGILVESITGGRTAVCGIGINAALPELDSLSFSQALRPIDLATVNGEPPDRNTLAGGIVTRLVGVAERFASDGFAPIADEWMEYDWLRGRDVSVSGVEPPITGVANGIGKNGELMLQNGGVDVPVVSGSVRPIDQEAER